LAQLNGARKENETAEEVQQRKKTERKKEQLKEGFKELGGTKTAAKNHHPPATGHQTNFGCQKNQEVNSLDSWP